MANPEAHIPSQQEAGVAAADWKENLRARAREVGFLDARVAAADLPAGPAATYLDWVAAGRHGEMTYMERLATERATGVEHILPGTRSVIVLAASYWSPDTAPPPAAPSAGSHVRVARYALGRDYHYILRDRMAPLIEWLQEQFPGHSFRPCVDSAPLLERAYAAASGIGFIGKNTMVISWMQGSFTFLCEILTTAEIPPDPPRHGTCGNCTRCLDACPTGAFSGPGVLDARRCISYLTIEKKTELTPEESAATGEWAFGCDICQDVCPYNKAPQPSSISDFAPGTIVRQHEPVETFLAPESNRQFERRFEQSPLLRTGKRRLQSLVRNKGK